jgi:hypothetical protein
MKPRESKPIAVAIAIITAHALSLVVPASSRGRLVPRPRTKRVHHYVFFGMDREKIPNAKSFFETGAFEGAQVTYSWRQLEHGKDNYDFGLIREDLALMSARDKKLWIQIEDVAFSDRWKMVPEYLLKDPAYHGGVVRQYKFPDGDEARAIPLGWVARRWDPVVQERYHKLLMALGKEFDGRIAGINLDETSIDFGNSGKLRPEGFNPELYRDAIIVNMKVLKRAFPKSIVMVYANFMPGGRPFLEAVYKAARASNIAVGGPDLLPFRPFQQANSYPFIRESVGIIPTGLAVQDGNYGDVDPKTGRRATIAELLKFATDDLKLDYVFWCTEEPYYSEELIPFMRSQSPAKNVRGTVR